ncbi:hypothetical protein Fot_24678 [Forsythia ovata]|uniref:Uncharacterized protein n=1 Tax=Forsythia ovata TaxID=205694 RepID=A0ABD1U6W6_9LAMI
MSQAQHIQTIETAPTTAHRLTNKTKLNDTLIFLLSSSLAEPLEMKRSRAKPRMRSTGKAERNWHGDEKKKRETEKTRREKWKEKKEIGGKKSGNKRGLSEWVKENGLREK